MRDMDQDDLGSLSQVTMELIETAQAANASIGDSANRAGAHCDRDGPCREEAIDGVADERLSVFRVGAFELLGLGRALGQR